MELEEDTELDPAAEFPILYGLLTAPKSEEKPKKVDMRRILRIEADSSLTSRIPSCRVPSKPVVKVDEEDESLPTSTTTLSEDEELEKSMKKSRRRFQAFKLKSRDSDSNDESKGEEEEEDAYGGSPLSPSPPPTLVSRVQNNGELGVRKPNDFLNQANQIDKLREIICLVRRRRAGLKRKVQEMNSQRSELGMDNGNGSSSSNHDLIVSNGKLSSLNLTYAILKRSHMLKKRHQLQPGVSNCITGAGSPNVQHFEPLEPNLKLNSNIRRHLGRRDMSNKLLHSYASLIRKRKESLAHMRNVSGVGREFDHGMELSHEPISINQPMKEDEDPKDLPSLEINENNMVLRGNNFELEQMDTKELEDQEPPLDNFVGSNIFKILHDKHEASRAISNFQENRIGNEIKNRVEESRDFRNNRN